MWFPINKKNSNFGRSWHNLTMSADFRCMNIPFGHRISALETTIVVHWFQWVEYRISKLHWGLAQWLASSSAHWKPTDSPVPIAWVYCRYSLVRLLIDCIIHNLATLSQFSSSILLQNNSVANLYLSVIAHDPIGKVPRGERWRRFPRLNSKISS